MGEFKVGKWAIEQKSRHDWKVSGFRACKEESTIGPCKVEGKGRECRYEQQLHARLDRGVMSTTSSMKLPFTQTCFYTIEGDGAKGPVSCSEVATIKYLDTDGML